MSILTRSLRTSFCAGLGLFFASEVQAQTIWNGAQDTAYDNPNNWSTGAVPTAGDDVVIPATPNQPVVNVLSRALNLTINNGASLTFTGTGILNVGGNLLDNGAFGGPGILQAVGTSAQTISGAGTGIGGQPINLNDLVVMNTAGVTLNHSMSLTRKLELSGNLATNSANVLTLLSSAASTAFVVNNGTAVVIGPVTVQRSINSFLNPTGLGYRHYSSPVSNTTIADLTTTGFTPVLTASYNTSTFPRATTPFPTVFDYEQARVSNANINYGTGPNIDRGFEVPGFNAVSFATGNAPAPTTAIAAGSSTVPLEVGRGYAVNIAGTALVDFVGTLNNGTITKNLLRNAPGTTEYASSGWHLLGNPYPGPIDFSVLAPPPGTTPNLVNVDAAIYVVRSTSQYGNTYRAYQSLTNSINPTIPLGQGFFIRVSNNQTAGSVTFANNQRITTSDNTPFERSNAITHPQVELSLTSVATPDLNDQAIIYLDNAASAGMDAQYDAYKLPNSTGLNMSTLTPAGDPLAIDGRPVPTGTLTIPMQVFVPVNGTYILQADQLRNMGSYYTYLRDIQTGTLTDLAQQASYTFSMVATNFTPRFEIVLSNRPLAAVSATLNQQVSLYPSPAKDVAFLELPATLGSQALTATFVDAVGRTARTTTLPAQGTSAHSLNLSGLAPGVYAVQLRTSAGLVVKRLVIQ